MKKLILILILFTGISATAQRSSFAVISNLKFSNGDKKEILDSLVRNINSYGELSFVLFSGSITSYGTRTEFESIKNSLDSLKSQYLLLPSGQDTRDAEGWNSFMEFFGEDKFVFNGNGFAFIGINPSPPYRGINFYTNENVLWLKEILDEINTDKEIYFFIPVEFEKVSNWQKVFNYLQKKNLKLIVNGSTEKFVQRNLNGINVVDIPAFNETTNNEPYISFISKDSITVTNSKQKNIIVIDKSILIDKQSADIGKPVQEKIDLLSNIQGARLTYASPLYWNGHIYTSSYNGIVACYDSTGSFMWDYNTFGNIIGTPVIRDRVIAVSTLQGDLITLSAITGEQIQTIGFEEMITTDLGVIEYQGNRILMIPKLTQSKSAIIFGTSSGKIFCYDLETLQEYWVNSNSTGMIRSNPVSIENNILFTGNDGYLYCIDSRNGLLTWRWKEKSETDFSKSGIATDGKKVFVVSNDGACYAIDLMLGKLTWKFDKTAVYEKFTFAENQKNLILKGKDSKIYLVNIDNGKIAREIKLDLPLSYSETGVIQMDKNILFTDKDRIFKTSNGSKPEMIYFEDYVPYNFLGKIDENKFIASNYNGLVIIFYLRQN
ncbi:MAG: PQQ-binding-like beta-propeller repeat protein [Melioribacteraceae bacterium]|nr:PQQ-binding-like beta-propeller repeat protein [Melioribacteraceae bacterium]